MYYISRGERIEKDCSSFINIGKMLILFDKIY